MDHVQEDRNHCFSNRYASRVLRKLRSGEHPQSNPQPDPRVLIDSGDRHLDQMAKIVFSRHGVID